MEVLKIRKHLNVLLGTLKSSLQRDKLKSVFTLKGRGILKA